MKHPVVLLLGGTLLALALYGALAAAPEDVAVGAIRAVLARDGATLRTQPNPLAPGAANLAYGAQVRVLEVQGRWIRVTPVAAAAGTTSGNTSGNTGGWLRAGQTVEPFALTQGGQAGAVAVRASEPTQSEISAAGRQFDEGTETDYRQSHPDLQRFYPLVDQIEKATPDPETVRRFVLEGRLGRPEGGR